MLETLLYILSIILRVGVIPVAVLIYKKKIPFLRGVFLSTLLFLMSFGCSVLSAKLVYGISIIDSTVNGAFNDFLLASETLYTADEMDMVRAVVESVRSTYFALIPSILVCTCLAFSYAFIMICKGVLFVFKKDVSMFLKFSELKMSKLGVLFGVLAFAAFGLSINATLKYAFLNFAAILIFATGVCGLSVTDFMLRKKIRLGVVRFLIYTVIFTLMFFTMGFGISMFLIFGAWDALFDLRRDRHIRKEN